MPANIERLQTFLRLLALAVALSCATSMAAAQSINALFRKALLILSLTLASSAFAQTTVTLMQGLNGYIGATDASLRGGSPNTNLSDSLEIRSESTDSGVMRFAIFASEGGPVPNGSTISSATLSLYKYDGPAAVFKASRLLRSWNESQVTWNNTGAGSPWATPGALGSGTDYLATADGQGSIADAAANGCTAAPYPAACWLNINVTSGVQAFAAGTPNFGWKVAEVSSSLPGFYKLFNAKENPNYPNLRPKLTVTYTPAPPSSTTTTLMVQAETMTLVAPMAAGYDIAAMGGRFISATSGTSTTNPVRSASVQVNIPAAGTYYLWARIAGQTIDSDALYVGIDTSFDRISPSALGAYEWVRVETSNRSGTYGFSLAAGNHDIQVGYGEIGAKLDAVYLTADAAEVPSFAPPLRLVVEAESMNRVAPMTVGSEGAALGGQYVSPSSGTNSTNPVREAWTTVDAPAGTFYLWARIAGPTIDSDALYVGIGSSFDRIFPSTTGQYQWVQVETSDASGVYAFSLAAGTHFIQVGHGEIGAKLDAVYLTNDSAEVPTFAPMRRVIEAESFNLTAPMTVGVDAAANGAQYISATSGTNSTVPVREAWTTVTAPTAGTYYLWARIKGPTIDSDALYVGFDNSWDRVFPSTTGAYEWVRVETADGSGTYGFSLTTGAHEIQVGHGEIGARLDAFYVTDDANDSPNGPSAPPLGACANPSGGYEGFGRNTTGGAGKPIYHVTNLNDGGSGSLRDALSVGDRCVVFDVGGTITLASELLVRSNVTIDGFTAPSPGITLIQNAPPAPDPNQSPAAVVIASPNGIDFVNNVVVRGIRVRGSPGDGISVYRGSNVVIDHVSVSGYGDGAIDVTQDSHEVTLQWNILGENIHNGNATPNLISYNSQRISVHHNLYTMGEYRHPMCSASDSASNFPPDIVCDVRNNLVWDFAGDGTAVMAWGVANIINNYYFSSGRAPSGCPHCVPIPIHIYPPIDHTDVYVNGNVGPRNNWNLDNLGNRTTLYPVPAASVPATTDAITAARIVRDNAGARNLPNWGLDATDQGYINQIPQQP